MFIADRLRLRPGRDTTSRAPGNLRTPALTERDLDLSVRHFGPTRWCRTWEEWQTQLWADRPERVFLIQDVDGEATVRGIYELSDLHRVPPTAEDFARLKYYRAHHGWVVSVSFALEAASEAAD